MPDITMCRDEDCISKRACYRYMAEPNPQWQSYFTESPRRTFVNKCEYYWPIEGEEDPDAPAG